MTVAEKIIVGVDIGTTNSGVAWAYSEDPDSIEVVTNWPAESRLCSDSDKVPTVIGYDVDGKVASWGYGTADDEIPLKWLKLLLLNNDDIPDYLKNSTQLARTRKQLKKLHKTAVEALSDYIRLLWTHSVQSIERAVGPELLAVCELHMILTVPAIWKPYAMSRTEKAAQMAIQQDDKDLKPVMSIKRVSEPEAAALATTRDVSKRSSIKVGDRLLELDAGGGTVDLISYVVTSIHPFEVAECTKGSGGLCGGVFLDDHFLAIFRHKIGAENWKTLTNAQEVKFLRDSWEDQIKGQYNGQDRSWLVDAPEDLRIQGNKRQRHVELSSQDLRSIFDPIMEKIEDLTERQMAAIRALPNQQGKVYIILVGGLGRNHYLFNRLRAAQPSATVIQSQGSKPWSAICRGAVMFGQMRESIPTSFTLAVKSRKARMSCGTICAPDWREGVHHPDDKIWDNRSWSYLADQQCEWFIKKRDDMVSEKPIRVHRYRDLTKPELSTERYIETVIHCCWSSEPPSRKSDAVQELCTIKWDLKAIKVPIPTRTNRIGKTYYRLTWDIEMTCHGGVVEFAVYVSGQNMGSKSVDIDFV